MPQDLYSELDTEETITLHSGRNNMSSGGHFIITIVTHLRV